MLGRSDYVYAGIITYSFQDIPTRFGTFVHPTDLHNPFKFHSDTYKAVRMAGNLVLHTGKPTIA